MCYQVNKCNLRAQLRLVLLEKVLRNGSLLPNVDISVCLCLFEEALIPYFSGVITEMIVASQMVIWYQQKQKLKNAISDMSVKGASNSVILKGYVRVRKT